VHACLTAAQQRHVNTHFIDWIQEHADD